MSPTGHIVSAPSCSVGLRFPNGSNVLFTGDLGNSRLGYPGTTPKIADTLGKYNHVVMEATYGNRTHGDRESQLADFHDVVVRAVRTNVDHLLVTLALERPIYALYEVIQALHTNNINPSDVDISYFGASIGKLFDHFPTNSPIYKAVKPYMKELQKDIKTLNKKGPKPRIILGAGGFFADGSPAATALMHLFRQNHLQITSVNFH